MVNNFMLMTLFSLVADMAEEPWAGAAGAVNAPVCRASLGPVLTFVPGGGRWAF